MVLFSLLAHKVSQVQFVVKQSCEYPSLHIHHLCALKKVMSLPVIVIDNDVVVSVKSVALVPQQGPCAGCCFPHLVLL